MATLRGEKLKQGTTPVLTVMVDGQDLTGANIYVTITSGDRKLIKTNRYNDPSVMTDIVLQDGVPSTEITIQFSQEDTLYLRPGNGMIEVEWINEDGTADRSDIGRLFIPRTLLKGVITYGEYTS